MEAPQNRERVGKGCPPKEHQFKPGNRANPGGRPKNEVSLTYYIKEAIRERDYEQAKALARAYVEHAKAGNAPYAKIVIDRVDGPVVEKQDITADVKVVYEFKI